ncbi:MAG: DUF2461 domain-containing protein [Bacteroidota bacterium]
MLQQHTFDFLAELKLHNNKEWFDANRGRYKEIRKEVIAFIDRLIEGILDFDPTLQGVEPKDCLFRINRDVRFSKNKDPYKTNFGANMVRGGRKSHFAGYYVNISPVEGFLAGGAYMPQPNRLKQIRHHIDMHGSELKEIVEDPAFISAFEQLRGDSLKTAPKGYPKDHPDIEWIRMKGFYVSTEFSPQVLLQEDAVEQIVEKFRLMHPLNEFLNEAMGE